MGTFGVSGARLVLMGAFLGSVILCAVRLAVLTRRGRSCGSAVHRDVLAVLVCAAGPVAVLAFLAGMHIGHASMPLAAALGSGAVLGASCSALTLAWLGSFAGLDYRAFVRAVALTFACGAGLLVPCFIIPPGLGALGYEAALIVLSTVLLVRRMLRRPCVLAALEGGCQGAEEEPRRSLRERVRVLWLPLLLAVIVAGVFGMVWDPALTPHQGEVLRLYGVALIAGVALAGALYVVATVRCNEDSLVSVGRSVVLPVAGGALLVLPTPAGATYVPGSFLLTSLSWACFATVFLWTWTLLTDIAHASGDLWVFGVALGACSLAMLAGLVAVPVLGSFGQVITVVLFAAYLVLTASFSQRGGAGDSGLPLGADGNADDYSSRCQRIAGDYQLSPRESEVLPYLCRGYSQAYIARELSISQNTVHTHVRNIYGKLGVSSKEDVIKLVEGWSGDTGV